MAPRSSKSSGSSTSSRSEATSKSAKPSNQNIETPTERAKGNASKRSSMGGGEKKSSGSKSSK